MIPVTYVRSSSFNNWGLCQHQYFLTYILGIPQPAGKKAQLGTILHKVMECLANAKVAADNGESFFEDAELGKLPVSYYRTPTFVDQLLTASFNYYTYPTRTTHRFYLSDKNTIAGWLKDTLELGKGIFDPRNRKIVGAESYFDVPLTEDWAKYDFIDVTTNQKVTGSLRLQGTIDLITEIGPNMYEVIDWKTGQRKDWATDKEKDFDKLSQDPQLRIYHYAVSQMFPEIKTIAMTINFVRDGGPFTMAYDADDIKETLEMLKIRCTQIRQCVRPSLKSNSGTHWFCTRVCHFGRTPHPKDPSKTICQYIKCKIQKQGLDETIRTESNPRYNSTKYQKSE